MLATLGSLNLDRQILADSPLRASRRYHHGVQAPVFGAMPSESAQVAAAILPTAVE